MTRRKAQAKKKARLARKAEATKAARKAIGQAQPRQKSPRPPAPAEPHARPSLGDGAPSSWMVRVANCLSGCRGRRVRARAHRAGRCRPPRASRAPGAGPRRPSRSARRGSRAWCPRCADPGVVDEHDGAVRTRAACRLAISTSTMRSGLTPGGVALHEVSGPRTPWRCADRDVELAETRGQLRLHGGVGDRARPGLGGVMHAPRGSTGRTGAAPASLRMGRR